MNREVITNKTAAVTIRGKFNLNFKELFKHKPEKFCGYFDDAADLALYENSEGFDAIDGFYCFIPISMRTYFYNSGNTDTHDGINIIKPANIEDAGRWVLFNTSIGGETTENIIEYSSFVTLPLIGEEGVLYVTLDTNKSYRWSGTQYTEISSSLTLGESSGSAYRGDRGKIAYDHSRLTHAPANAQKNSDITPVEIAAKLPTNVLLNDGTTQMMDSQVQEILSRPFSFIPINSGGDGMSYYANNINLYSGDFRSIFTNGSFIKLYGGIGEYYVVVQWTTYHPEMNMTNIAIESEYTPLPYFLYLVKISNIPVAYIPKNPKDIATKEYVDNHGNTSEYVHPTNHPPSIISQDEYNRFVSDIEKATWTGKSNFSGAYSDLSGKPSFKTINGNSIIGNGDITISGGGTSTPETATSIGALINSSSSKGTPVDGDMFAIRDSVTGLLQKLPFLALKGTLKTYFDQFYGYVFKTINGQSILGNGDITISGGGTSTPETATSIGALINSSTDKSAPVDADMFAIRDSVTGFLQKISFSNLKKVFKDYFDTLYNNYTHPANHPAAIITQDVNNRFVTDTDKSNWNGKSNFSGAYNDLSGKPSIPTSLSQLTEDSTHKFITEAEKGNIPKNTALVQDFSQSSITIDFTNYDIQEDGGFDSNIAITTGNKTIAITNPFLNKVVTVLLPKISEGTVIRLPAECKKLTGDYNDTLQNIVMIHCTKTSPARYLYTISQIQA